jgi:hypothetical protein
MNNQIKNKISDVMRMSLRTEGVTRTGSTVVATERTLRERRKNFRNVLTARYITVD